MILLIAFAFLAGVVTILSPCILPVLPIILSSSVDASGKRRPLGVIVGFVASFTFFTLFLSTLVRLIGIPATALRQVSTLILAILGLTLLVPKVQLVVEQFFSRIAQFTPNSQKRAGFAGGVVIGFSLGLLWTPCVGPILASVISLAITGTVTVQAAIITLAYSLGTAIPMFAIMLTGSAALRKVPWLVRNTANIRQGFGVLMILTAIGIFFSIDRRFQAWILQTFPQYGVGLTKFEDNEPVKQRLKNLREPLVDETMIGKPVSQLTQPKGILAPALIPGGEWFNSLPLQLSDLRGKVVLIDFWTYSCINCQRTLPYLRTWWNKYQSQGLVIIGVHSPEFEFEKKPSNVSQAIADFKLEYPVMQDNDFATWRAYQNRYWPAKYLIDKDGYIRYTHFGEGNYDETEMMIQELLQETGAPVSADTIENSPYQIYARTPELYLGYSRIQYLASPERILRDKPARYSSPDKLSANLFGFEGEWTIRQEYASPSKGSQLYLNFDSKEVFLVARPTDNVGTIKVYLDGQMQAFGADNNDGVVTIDSDRLYKLIELDDPDRHELRIEFEDDNVEVYAFTFG